MDKLIKSLMGLITLGALSSPVKALTEEELAIGLQLASCFSSNGCYYQPRHYNDRYYDNNRFRHSNPYNKPPHFHRSSPQIIIVPARPQYRYTPPYSGYYFEQDRHRFRQRPNYGYHRPNNFNYGYHQDVRGQINQIYRHVLGRDADFDGLNTYQDRYNSGWSLIDIQRDIANSNEARNLRRY